MTFIYTSLYGKYKNGEYISKQQIENERSTLAITDRFTEIDLSGYKQGGVSIKHSDSFAIRIDNGNSDKIQYHADGRKLTLTNKTEERYIWVTVYCPSFSKLSVAAVNVEIDPIALTGCLMDIGADASVTFTGTADSLTAYIQRGGRFNVGKSADIRLLNLHLFNGSIFNNEEGSIRQIGNLALEDSAVLNVNGKTMRMISEKNKP
ncbi:hypothetical protein [Agriterribacter sp.]|uniref:hypothetical protein n=1 Tax=Agriterribacter sp. TaxID=2821509 RepID=UPI002BDAB8F6|nr:hypothetical protein [Agriterribacter sp.]HTN06783.1 hypothetical protein [Agriterribacter sp.]